MNGIRRVGAVLATGAMFLAGEAARAAPLSGSEVRARATGGEFRGYGSTPRSQLEDVIWRFRPDGTVSSLSQLRRKYPQANSQFEEYSDAGTWRVEGDRLCVAFGGSHREYNGCYGVDGVSGDQVRLSGPVQLQGTLGH